MGTSIVRSSSDCFVLICSAVPLNDTVRVHDAELNSCKQIFHPLIHVVLGCFAIDQDGSLRLHLRVALLPRRLLFVVFDSGGKIRSNPGCTPRNCTSIAKLDQVSSANPQKNKEMSSVWATNGISRKLQPGNALPVRKTFSLSRHRGVTPSVRCDRPPRGCGVQLTVDKSRLHPLTVRELA
jgi:hypothetical protein